MAHKTLYRQSWQSVFLAACLLPTAAVFAQNSDTTNAAIANTVLINSNQSVTSAANNSPPVRRENLNLTETQTAFLNHLLDTMKDEGLIGEKKDMALHHLTGEALIDATLDYARAVHNGRLSPNDFDRNWGLKPDAYDPWPDFKNAVSNNTLNDWAGNLPPPYSGYNGLKNGLMYYRAIAAKGGWPVIPTGADLSMGSEGSRVRILKKRLSLEDKDLKDDGSSHFDAKLREAVKRAQQRYGLNPTGVVSRQTLEALNQPIKLRIHQIMANMERWRWLPRNLPANRIQVNIAAAVLTLFDKNQPVMSMKSVTGRPGNETPMLRSTIYSVVINPPWNVPDSIAKKELWPKEKAHPGYLQAAGFKVIGEGKGQRLQQKPGPRNSLGQLKFDFPNTYSVYLHDTPGRGAFNRFSRLESHGCIRLEHPIALGERLLASDPTWTGDRLRSEIDKNETQRVKLKQPVAVFLFYWTAFGSGENALSFRDDPYKWDELLAQKIETIGQAVQGRSNN
ncbi:MAG: L,D-transpeptidase family protein [Zymomonas mobilis subsp. pomaceae]|nr:L,D-transpeptidase family protein [Zymomonas mobilis]MDX5947936.1 L,D-transpeptidase family protein [Zymomonas mobilis subsp. pomaceae]GEB89265.1 peptidoglycan-binding protein [Zymomonas mobilis subsp. pomaceae]